MKTARLLLKDDVDVPEGKHGIRADVLDVRDAQELRRERIDHLVFHVLRAPSRPIREHDDLILPDVRDGVHGRPLERPHAGQGDQEESHENRKPILQAYVNDAFDHSPFLRLSR